MNYDKEYFIRKFEAIPDEKWCVGVFRDEWGRRCAFGHCGRIFKQRKNISTDTVQGIALRKLFQSEKLSVSYINDNLDSRYPQPTPKARILAALHDLP